jgi:hypothetical protein
VGESEREGEERGEKKEKSTRIHTDDTGLFLRNSGHSTNPKHDEGALMFV